MFLLQRTWCWPCRCWSPSKRRKLRQPFSNQISAIMAKVSEAHKKRWDPSWNAALCKSIINWLGNLRLLKATAQQNSVLTGFKFIAEKIQNSKKNTITHTWWDLKLDLPVKPFVRDKDHPSCPLLLLSLRPTALVAWLLRISEEIYKELWLLYWRLFLWPLSRVSMVLSKSKRSWLEFRENGPKSFNEQPVSITEDFKAQTSTAADGTVTALTTPQVMYWNTHLLTVHGFAVRRWCWTKN